MLTPPYIKLGDKIRIVAPAGKPKKEHVLPALEWFEKHGYNVELGKHIFSSYFQYSGTDEQRFNDLQVALNDTDCKAIICARGGYGTVRILGNLDFTAFKRNPKWLVGYSDITVLHAAINKLGFESIHGTMPPFFFDNNGVENENLKSLINLLRGASAVYKINSVTDNRIGLASGKLTGGNLSLLTSVLASEYEINTDRKILFIEDIDEHLYQIDRMIRQLKLAGKLENLAALLVGDFTNIKEEDSFGETLEEIIMEAVKDYNYPVCFGLKAGHGDLNLALTFGRKWELNVSENQTILKTI